MRVSLSRMFMRTLRDVVTPPLQTLGLFKPLDPTYGRYLLPPSHTYEVAHSSLYDDVKITRRRLYTTRTGHGLGTSHEISLTQSELQDAYKSGNDSWVAFQTFEKRDRVDGDVDADLVLVHGYGDYGGKWVANAAQFIQRGYRVIALDLPGHGRSSGLHVFVPSCNILTQAVASVVKDVYPPNRQVFVLGHSLGGFLAINYALQYPPVASPAESNQRPNLAGVYALSPMLGISPETRPPWVVETVARALASFIGHVPLIKSDGSLKTEDERVLAETLSDIRVYQGALRIGTGLALLSGVENINRDVAQLKAPLRICHGDADRVTLCDASRDFIRRANNEKSDKSLKIMQGINHVMLADKPTKLSEEVVRDAISWMDNYNGVRKSKSNTEKEKVE